MKLKILVSTIFILIALSNACFATDAFGRQSNAIGRASNEVRKVSGHCNCGKKKHKRPNTVLAPPKLKSAFLLEETTAQMAHSSCCKKKKTVEQESMSMPAEDDGPGMNMYFTDEMPFYLLFKFWVPSTTGQYWFAVLMMLLTGVMYEGLKTFQAILEHKWAASGRNSSKCYGMRDAIRASLTFVSTVISYALMLAAMCFNTGIFFAVCGGFALGVFVFGRYKPYSPVSERDCCGS